MSDQLKRAIVAAMQADHRPDMINLGDQLLALDPGNHLGLSAVASAMLKSEKYGIAAMLLGMLTKMRPDDAEVWNNFACAMQEYHPQEALHALERAMRLEGELDAAVQNTVGVLSTLGRFSDAVEVGRDYLQRDPTNPDVNHNLGLAEMQTGDWKRAWTRWRYSHKRKDRAYPHREGEDDFRDVRRLTDLAHLEAGDKLVIYGEQGLGDEILAGAMIDRLVGTDAEIILECEPRLEGLFRRSFPQVQVFGTLLEDYPRWVSIEKPTHKLESMGLGELLAPEPFRRDRYLVADGHYRAMFRGLLESFGPGLKVGIAWTGGVKAWDRAQRCIDPELLKPILASPGCQFVSLEYQFNGPPPAGVHEIPWATAKGVDYDLTAALIAELDLVISVPQTCVDAAGALGVPCWVLTPPVPQWRFSEAAGDEAWVYQGVEIIRRQGPFWQGAIAKAAQRLRNKTQGAASSGRLQ